MKVITAHDSHSPLVKPVKARRERGHRAAAHGADKLSQRHKKAKKPPKRPSDADLAMLFSNTATLLNSGIPLTKALEALTTDDSLSRTVPTIEALIQDITSGTSFSGALSKHPEVFSPMVMSLVRAGEASGTLVSALERLAQSLEDRRETIAQIRQSLTYPGIVLIFGTLAIGFLMIFVVPTFQETYAKAGMTLPAITRVLIAMSVLFVNPWWIGCLLLGSMTLLYRHYRSHPQLQLTRDRLLLRMPVLGPVLQGALVGRFVRTFGSLLSGGISVKESLALTERVVGHAEFVGMVRELRLAVDRGEGVGNKLSEYTHLVPPLLARMIILGEKSGDLGNMIMKVGEYSEKDFKRRMKRMSTLIEPLITVVMAFAIGAIAMAIYLPIFDMFQHIK